MQHIKILPLLIIVAFFAFAVRLSEVVVNIESIANGVDGSVMAATKADDEKPKNIDVPEGLPADEPATLPETEWADPAMLDMQFSETQTSVLKELKERREVLNSREDRLNQREALMKVTERRIEEKTEELMALRSEIEELLGDQTKEEAARIESLVKIYSGMKPKDAAAVFDDLDLDILLEVVGQMSERKSAPILAAMDTKKVQELTVLLAEQKKLPEFPQ